MVVDRTIFKAQGMAIRSIHLIYFLLCLVCQSCVELPISPRVDEQITKCEFVDETNPSSTQRALIATRFKSLDEFYSIVQVEYKANKPNAQNAVQLVHCSQGFSITSWLHTGLNEGDLKKVRDGSIWDKIKFGLSEPFLAQNRRQLQKIFILARRKPDIFGQGDVAFYDLALNTSNHIYPQDLTKITNRDTSEKGFINTFNHVTAQALVTSIYSEQMADFIADAHERYSMPELLTGNFSEEQINDSDNNPIDNFVDIVNNEWGQELGKALANKYKIHQRTTWTPLLLSNYLNDLQDYYSWSLRIRLEPYRPSDEVVVRFSEKLNKVLGNS